MINPLFTDDQFTQMAAEVRRVLAEIGYHVAHPEAKRMALAAGCRESPAGRVLFFERHIAELSARLEAQYPPRPPGWQPTILHPRRPVGSSFGNLAPKVYDYVSGRALGGTLGSLVRLTKFVHTEPRFTSLTLPLSRQDVAPALEQLDSLVQMARLTDKPLGALDTTVPEAVPFVAAMGEVLGREPAEFVGCCNCINPPLRLEERTAATMLQRARYHSLSMITPMPCIGGSGPVDTHGSIVLGTAEIVGGLILSMIIDPQAPLLGYIACTGLDMRNGNITSSSPQTVQVDAGVYQLMEKHFGGGTRVGGRTYVTAKRPGLQAVYEKMLKGIGYAALVDRHALGYPGGGVLDNGSLISPEQALLDLEISTGLDGLWTCPLVSPPDDVVSRLRESILDQGGNFLVGDHTLSHYRDESWDPEYFHRGIDTATEQMILDHAHAHYRECVDSYQPASHPPEVIRELERILAHAEQELC